MTDEGRDPFEEDTRQEKGRGRTVMQPIARDLVLSPIGFAHIRDNTGNIKVWVGPARTSLAETDQPVRFNPATEFEDCSLEEATHASSRAAENQYIVLENPATRSEEEGGEHPAPKQSSDSVPLSYGRTLNIHGPTSFPLWPGQLTKVIDGHRLRSNEYIIVEIYNEKEAWENWSGMVLKPQTETESPDDEAVSVEDNAVLPAEPPERLSVGQRFIVPGTLVSFYMPPTGIRVVEERGSYVEKAVTLERLEYCILLSEQGRKRYVRGPSVVFPRPDEAFVKQHGEAKFKAVELTPLSGIYVKVIADYKEGGRDYTAGKELFITGTEQAIYWPREEHAVIRYGEHEIHFAVAIPEGEARYVLNRESGDIDLVKGPKMFLPNPITQVTVRRVISGKEVDLWFPGNSEALAYNRDLAALSRKGPGRDYVEEQVMLGLLDAEEEGLMYGTKSRASLAAEDFTRKTTFTPPRTIVLDTKYEGAVTIEVWPQYAVMVVDKTGKRRVVIGPEVVLLEYDETLTTLEMLRGTPKTDKKTIRTVYLLTRNNRVRDIVEAETADLVKVELLLTYRVNFEGETQKDREKWFAVENYVKLLVEHIRSMIRATVKQVGIEKFYKDPTSIIRDAILGVAEGDEGRPGRHFEENSMRIYDVEVLRVDIGDENISDLLQEAQHDAVEQTLALAKKERELEATQRNEEIKQETLELQDITAQKQHEQSLEKLTRRLAETLAELQVGVESAAEQLEADQAQQKGLDAVAAAARERQRADEKQKVEALKAEVEVQVKAMTDQIKAVPPQLAAVLQAYSDKALMERLAETMAPLAILGGKSVIDALSQLLGDLPLAERLAGLFSSATPEAE